MTEPQRSDYDLGPQERPRTGVVLAPSRAAVLIGLIERGDDFGVLLTLRPDTMARHAGQVAFPGGRIDAGDGSALRAALREAHEEVGVDAERVRVIGQTPPYLTSTGFLVAPFVGILPDDFTPSPDPREVADVFETPLSFLMDPRNHELHERSYGGVVRSFFAMPHNGRYIWGATAGIIRGLYDGLYGDAGKD
ncbi:CoA pyrophosphatase [bacterium]|nr:CoA pyrophosphatase [bacterium]